jgi:predicted transposase YbfD/YdcC
MFPLNFLILQGICMSAKENEVKAEIHEQVAEWLKESVLQYFGHMTDPRRRSRSVLHKLLDIIFMALCAMLSGARDLPSIALYVKEKEQWFTQILNLKKGVPSENTFWWVFMLINPSEFEQGFVQWIQIVAERVGGIVAIDGKTLRGTVDADHLHSSVHMVSAWSSMCNFTLAQLKVEDKSNEITAIPKLLDMIDIKGSIVTIDAMGCQTKIVEKIIANGGDYLLAVKENQPHLYYELQNYFNQVKDEDLEIAECQLFHSSNETEKEKHGRKEERKVYSTGAINFLPQKNEWKGLQSIVCIRSKRTIKEKTTEEARYYISSTPPNAAQQGIAARIHWGIENKVNWMLDVGFREDTIRAKAGNIAENLAVLRHMALNVLKNDKETKLSIAKKQFKAAINNEYVLKLLRSIFKRKV